MKLWRDSRKNASVAAAAPPVANVYYPWGGIEFEPNELAPHFAVMGVPESGKTLTIRLLMRAALVSNDGQLRHRALVYDPKRDFLPLLVGMGIRQDAVDILHPFDVRSVAWDLASDVTDHAASRQFAEILAPPDKNSAQPFFSTAGCDLLAGVIDVLREVLPNRWCLNDAVEAFASQSTLREVLDRTVDGRSLLELYFNSEKTTADILATVRSKIAPYTTVARLWARAPKPWVSLTKWAAIGSTPRVLLLGTDETNGATLDPINRALFKRASQLVTARCDENPKDESWFFIDEARWAGQLEGIAGLILKGRTKGAHVVLGFQDLLGLRHVYGREQADELVGQCGNIAVLKLNSPDTMAWASSYFGKYEEYVRSYGWSTVQDGKTAGQQTYSENFAMSDRQAMMEQEFLRIPRPTPSTGITGAFSSPEHAWKGTVPPALISRYLRGRADVAEFIARPPSDQAPLPESVGLLAKLGRPNPSPAEVRRRLRTIEP